MYQQFPEIGAGAAIDGDIYFPIFVFVKVADLLPSFRK
jgi:hypothetical protein